MHRTLHIGRFLLGNPYQTVSVSNSIKWLQVNRLLFMLWTFDTVVINIKTCFTSPFIDLAQVLLQFFQDDAGSVC